MEPLIIEQTHNAPRVVFNPENNFFEIFGESRVEDIGKFYAPVIGWLDDYGLVLLKNVLATEQGVAEFSFNFRLTYFNSSSAKFLLDILVILKKWQFNKIPVAVYWYYDEEDTDMHEAGQEMSEMSGCPMIYVENIEE
jgi:hypothetical protein